VRLRTFRGLLERDGLLLVHGGDDSDKEIFTVIESRSDLRAKITLWNLNVILRDAIHGHQVKETVVDVDELVFRTPDIRDIHVVGRGTDIFQFFSSEDVDGDEMNLGMTMLSGLGGRHVHNLAGTALDDDVAVLAESRTLRGEGEGGPSAGLLKGMLVSFVSRHGE